MARTFTIISLIIVTISCAAIAGLPQRDSVELEDDPFSSTLRYLGVTERITDSRVAADSYIRTFVDRETNKATHQLYVIINYMGNWHFFERATMEGGDPLTFTQIDRQVMACSYSCSYRETVGIGLSESLLKENVDGLQIMLYASSGRSKLVEVTRRQIEAQLAAVNINEE